MGDYQSFTNIALQIPTVGTTGTIQNGAGSYLSVNANTAPGSAIVLEAVLDSSDVGQLWERSADDDSGFFTLKNPNSGLFLTYTGSAYTIGNTIPIFFYILCCFCFYFVVFYL